MLCELNWVEASGSTASPTTQKGPGFQSKLPAVSHIQACCGGRQPVHLQSQYTSKSAKQWQGPDVQKPQVGCVLHRPNKGQHGFT